MLEDNQTVLLVPLSALATHRLDQAAARQKVSTAEFARKAIELAVGMALEVDAGSAQLAGYRWKNVVLPEGTVLSFTHRGTPHLATVSGSEILHEGRSVSPSEFVNGISGATRNAWRDLWVKRPDDSEWVAAQDLRNVATEEDLAKQIDAVSKSAPSKLVAAPGVAAADALSGLLGRRRRFGSLPVSERMGPRYLQACRSVLQVIETHTASDEDLAQISEAKGMFNRIVKRDRHDWQYVQQMLGMPDRASCMQAVMWLAELRSLVKSGFSLQDQFARPAAAFVEGSLRQAMLELEKQGFSEMMTSSQDCGNGEEGSD